MYTNRNILGTAEHNCPASPCLHHSVPFIVPRENLPDLTFQTIPNLLISRFFPLSPSNRFLFVALLSTNFRPFFACPLVPFLRCVRRIWQGGRNNLPRSTRRYQNIRHKEDSTVSN